MFWCILLYIYSSFAIILLGKRELVALLFFFLASHDSCVVVVFPDHTHLLCFGVNCVRVFSYVFVSFIYGFTVQVGYLIVYNPDPTLLSYLYNSVLWSS